MWRHGGFDDHEHLVRARRIFLCTDLEAHLDRRLRGIKVDVLAHVGLGALADGRHEGVYQQVLRVALVEVEHGGSSPRGVTGGKPRRRGARRPTWGTRGLPGTGLPGDG